MQRRLAAVLIGVTLVVGTASATASTRDPVESLTVCLAVSSALPISVAQKTAILSEANAVWQLHGVVIREGWHDEYCDRLIAVKSDLEARPEDASQLTALAWVPFVEGRARRVLFVRVNRAKTLIDGVSPGTRPQELTDLLVAKLIGRSLAHELGHVLLNTREHETTGLMRARYRAHDVLRDPPVAYTLDAQQRARLFANQASDTLLARR